MADKITSKFAHLNFEEQALVPLLSRCQLRVLLPISYLIIYSK